VYSFHYNVIGITKTRLHSTISDNEILHTGFSIYRTDRDTRGGGVLLAISNSIPTRLVESHNSLELVVIYVGLNNPVCICWLYNPPNASINYKQDLITYLSSDPTPLIIMGDLQM